MKTNMMTHAAASKLLFLINEFVEEMIFAEFIFVRYWNNTSKPKLNRVIVLKRLDFSRTKGEDLIWIKALSLRKNGFHCKMFDISKSELAGFFLDKVFLKSFSVQVFSLNASELTQFSSVGVLSK